MSEKEKFDYGKRLSDGQYERHPTNNSGEFVAPLRNAYKHNIEDCGGITTIGQKDIVETYAKNPKYYSNTFCSTCHTYPSIEEFVWLENGKVTEITLGTYAGEPGEDLRSYRK